VTSIHFASSTTHAKCNKPDGLETWTPCRSDCVYSGCAERSPVVRCVGSGSQLGGQWTMDVHGQAVNRVTGSIIARPTLKYSRGCMAVKCRPSNITGAGCRRWPARDVSSSLNIIRSLYTPCGRRSCRDYTWARSQDSASPADQAQCTQYVGTANCRTTIND